jgi:septal ring factor EnvC (AmiA/AmiB activator)
VPPQSRTERPVSTVEGLVTRTALRSVTAARLQQLSTMNTIPGAERGIIGEAAARQRELEDAAKELERSRAEIKKTEKDLERLREHLKALGGAKDTSGPEGSPLVRRILEAEDRLTALGKKLDTLEGDQERRRDAVKKALERLPKRVDKR